VFCIEHLTIAADALIIDAPCRRQRLERAGQVFDRDGDAELILRSFLATETNALRI
jgi:hypothetical protein